MPDLQVSGLAATTLGLALVVVVPIAVRFVPDQRSAGGTAGKSLFEGHCSDCHGLGGQGGRAPDLTDPSPRRGRAGWTIRGIISDGIPGTEMPASGLDEQEVEQLMVYLDTLVAQEPQAVTGNFQRGKALYYGSGGCSTCHWLNGSGGLIGPELSAIGQRRSASHLRQSLLDPAADFPAGFQLVSAVLSDGSTLEGLRLNEDPFTIQLRADDDSLHSLEKSSLQRLERLSGKSSMPSFAKSFTAVEIEDVVAFLAALPNENAGQ